MEGMQGIIGVFCQMADHGNRFSLNLNQMQNELTQLTEYTERERKQIKQSGLAAEERVQDAERQMERAKAKYYSLAQELSHVRRSHKTSSRRITLRGPKSTGQFEEELHHKVDVADEDYQAKVANAQKLRQELLSTLRPRAVYSLKLLISQIDANLTIQMQELGTCIPVT